jgi:hypothetical protein
MGHGEFDVGFVSLVNLYTLRQFPVEAPGRKQTCQDFE